METIGIILFTIGFIVLALIIKQTTAYKGVIIIFSLLLMCGGGSLAYYNGSIIIGLVLVAAAFAVLLFLIARLKSQAKANSEKMYDEKKVAFYNECVNNGIAECKSEWEREKASLLAQKFGLSFSNISDLFDDAKNSFKRNVEDKEASALEVMRKNEINEFDKLRKYSNLTGRNKRIAMLTDERDEAKNKAEVLRNGSLALMRASQQKELDWAVHGGIASGIAGAAAGLATAVDVQARNAQIRAQNELNLRALSPTIMTSYSGASEYEKKASHLNYQIEAAKTKLVANDDAMSCLSWILFSNTKVEVSDTGTCTVTTSAKLASPILIYNEVEAVVDGTIIARILNGNTLVGMAQLVLPVYGVKGETELKGMCLFCGQKGGSYSVEFTAENLWAMEI